MTTPKTSSWIAEEITKGDTEFYEKLWLPADEVEKVIDDIINQFKTKYPHDETCKRMNNVLELLKQKLKGDDNAKKKIC